MIGQAMRLNTGFTELTNPAAVLSPYVSACRYPGGSDESMPTQKKFDEALQHAQTIYDFVKIINGDWTRRLCLSN